MFGELLVCEELDDGMAESIVSWIDGVRYLPVWSWRYDIEEILCMVALDVVMDY